MNIMKKLIFSLLIFLSASFMLTAQNDMDALRYTQTTFGGTARYMAMSGSFGALGADFSILSTNPGGLGLYKKSEMTITPALYFGNTNSTFNGTTGEDSKTNFNLGNAGVVIASQLSGGNSILKYWQFAVGLNRLNNFNNRSIIWGFNNQNSIVDTYVEGATGINYEDIENDAYGQYAYDLNLAWNAYAIDTLPGNVDQYYGAMPPGGGIMQRKYTETWGSMNEFLLAFGANVGDRLYLGASFAFPYIRYFETSVYDEIDEDDNIPDFRSLTRRDDIRTSGGGFNMKFGVILRATNWLRLGGSVHTPTWFNNMNDYWSAEINTQFDNNDYFTSFSPYGSYRYDLETPWRAMGSIGLVLGKFFLINAEYEFVDYTKAKLSAPEYQFFDENQAIKSKYSEGHNFKFGTEFRFGHIALRGGAGIYGSPFAENANGQKINDGEKIYYSGGIGFRDENFFIDLAYVGSVSDQDYYLYGTEDISVNPTKQTFHTNNILLTLGIRY